MSIPLSRFSGRWLIGALKTHDMRWGGRPRPVVPTLLSQSDGLPLARAVIELARRRAGESSSEVVELRLGSDGEVRRFAEMSTRPALLVAIAWATATTATTLVPMDVPALTRASDLVARVRVSSSHARWATPRRLVTVAECEVLEVLSGGPLRTLKVVTPGGELAEWGQHVAGSAELAVGEEAVLFLHRVARSTDVFEVTGMAQGKWTVKPELGPIVMVEPQPITASLVGPAVGRAPMTLQAVGHLSR